MASNTITLSSVSGTPQTEVEIVVSLDNTDAITALEMVLPLGEHLSYVDGSATLTTTRSNGHQISAAQVGQNLRIYIYSLSLNAIPGNTGELLTFRLLLGNEPANYALTPTVVLSDAQGTSLAGSVQAGNVAIQAPKLQIVNPQIDYGHIPIRATYTKNLQLKNAGTLPLTIENITTTDPLFVPKQTTLTIAEQQTASVTIEYAPVERGATSAEVMVKSNAINGDQVATIMADPFSVNELHVGSTSGIADSIVTISLTMNNMEPIVAMQCAFKLPKQLEYVANSLAVNATRNNGHQALSTLRGDTLFLAIFSMTNQPLHANDGEIASFQLRLNGSSGTYYLKPIDVVLSNITEENMVSATSQGSVRINAPSISSNASLSFGNIPITEVAYATYSVLNNGSAPLVLERATFLAEGYSVVEELPITIANSNTTTITVAYQPTEEGDFSTTMNLYTNDPNNRLKTVALSGHVYEPNTLTLDGQNNQDGTYTLSVALENYTDIVAVQYDLHWRSDMTTSQAAFKPSERMSSHSYSVTPLGDDTYQIIIYSMSNATIAGHNGELHQLVFTPQGSADYCGDVLSIDNIVLSNANGTDKASQSTVLYHFPTKQYSEQTITVCDQYVYNNKVYQSSGTYIDTLQTVGGCDSIVTTHLTVFYSEHEEYNVTACDQYEWYGNTYTQSGNYEYRTTITHVAEKLYVGYNSQNDPIIGLTPPRGISRFTVDGYITNGSGACFVGTGSPENGIVDDEGDLRIFDAGCFYYDRMSGRNSCFFYDFREAFNIEFGNYYAKNIETGEYYFNAGENVYEYSNTEYPITLFYKDYGKIHKVQFFDNNNLLWADINAVIEGGLPMIKIDYYEADGTIYHTQKFTENLYVDPKNDINISYDCERVEILHLAINHTQYAEEIVTACDSYTWTDGKTYTKSGTYYQYLQTIHGCDSTVVLHLTINNSVAIPYEVTACDSYTWSNGITYTQSGVYYDSLKTIHGCDSVEILTLTINYSDTATFAATACNSYIWHDKTYTTSGVYEYLTQTVNGCDSLEVLTLTINNRTTTEQTEVACDSYTWTDGKTYTQSGTYYQYLQTIHGCDSTVVLHLTINNSVVVPYEVTTCDSYTWSNGNTYTQSGVYYDSLKTIQGCDSVEILTLTINYSDTATFAATACNSYIWHDKTYTTSGVYEYLTQTVNGCDSLEVLTLTINNRTTTEQTEVACDSYTWTDGKTYTQSGTYYQYLQTVHGCDSIITLHLTINQKQYAEETITACDSYTWNDQTYTESGEYVYNTTASNGCDSIVTLHLTINQTQYAEETIVACDSYAWNGETYTESGEYTYTTTAANGCDSIVTLHLTVNTTKYTEETVTACDSYIWNGETYTASGEYTYNTTAANGCERVEVLHLTINKSEHVEFTETACDSYVWNGLVYTESGDYTYTTTTEQGCERVEVLHLTINRSEREEFYETACNEFYWDHNGETYYESGDYEYYTTTDQGCERVEVLHLTINRSEREEYTAVACDEYWWHDNQYTESGDYTYNTTTADGCERVEVLHLTILPEATIESGELALCPSELPYEWYGQSLTEEGTYSATEQYAGMECDSVIHELTLNVYVQTLPAAVTLPIVRTGEAIDVTIPTAEIQAHIAAETWYAPNAEVAWYIMENSDWTALTTEPVAAGTKQVVLKYAVATDCGSVESDNIVIDVTPTSVENTHSQSPTSDCQKILYDQQLYIYHNGSVYTIMGQEM